MSKRHPGSRRAHQEPSADPDDIFLARLLAVGNWARANQQLVTILGVILVIAGAVIYWYYIPMRTKFLEAASEQIESVHQSIMLQDTEGAKNELVIFIESFSGTAYEGEARLLLGDLYLQSADPQQARQVLEPLGSSPRAPIEFQGAALLGAAYEEEGRLDDAEATYLRIAERSELDFQVRNALSNAARIKVSQGDGEGAIRLYQRALDTFEANEPARGIYELRIQELMAAGVSQ
ncbi:MAG TPA: tetratricopeptide repeat protein [Gemmatimonadetes bacterium]|nr:tetratricopeptide repeat protein [Gemmatimonadota bacterium]